MTDESPDKQSNPEPEASASGDSAGDDPVDVLLDRASALASEMAAELGDASPEQRATHAEETLTDLNDLAKGLEKELEQMDVLARQVGDQVGEELSGATAGDGARPGEEGSGAATGEADATDPMASAAAAALDQALSEEIETLGDQAAASERSTDTGVAEGAESEVPDYMLEFLAPDEPKTPKARAEPSENSPSVSPTVPATEFSFDDDLTAAAVERSEAQTAARGTGESRAGEGSPEDGAAARRGKLAALKALGPIVTGALTRALCMLLDTLDRPLGRIPAGVRELIGIAALATLATAVLVFAMSMI